MANYVLDRSDVFPVGTTVGAYAVPAPGSNIGAPGGAAVESQAVASNGRATFTTLSSDRTYIFAASVNGEWRHVQARISSSQADRGVATGTATTSSGSATVTSATATTGAFVVGQRLAGPGIPPNARIRAVSGGTLTLTEKATASGTGVAVEASNAKDATARVLQERNRRGTS